MLYEPNNDGGGGGGDSRTTATRWTTVTDKDGAILGGMTRTSRWAALGVAVHIGRPAPPWGEGEDDAVLLQ